MCHFYRLPNYKHRYYSGSVVGAAHVKAALQPHDMPILFQTTCLVVDLANVRVQRCQDRCGERSVANLIKCGFCHLLRVVWCCKYTNFVQKNEKKSFFCTGFCIFFHYLVTGEKRCANRLRGTRVILQPKTKQKKHKKPNDYGNKN